MIVHFADLKPLVNSYIQQEVQIKWDVSIHGRDLYLLKPTLGPPKRFRHLTRADEVVITRLRIGHTKATKSHILSRGPPTACQHCGQTLTIDQSHRYGRHQAACREPVGSYDKSTQTAMCFEHKTQYLLIRAPYTRILVFWHISNIPPMISQSN